VYSWPAPPSRCALITGQSAQTLINVLAANYVAEDLASAAGWRYSFAGHREKISQTLADHEGLRRDSGGGQDSISAHAADSDEHTVGLICLTSAAGRSSPCTPTGPRAA
jgi:hypothetical protein